MRDKDWEPWKGEEWDSDGRFGPDVRSWFRKRMEFGFHDLYRTAGDLAPGGWGTKWWPYVPAMVDWFTARADEFVEWRPYQDYRGEGWANGAWVLLTGEIQVRLTEARDAVRFQDLDNWLRADISGDVAWAPHEGCGWDLLSKEEQERFEAHTERVSREWPIVCRDCGESFRQDRPNVVRCRECRGHPKSENTAREIVE